MPEFISKVQHKTYEKGEFTDEKARSLDETIELIKGFPWDNERTLTDVQLTGPSVTIQDEYVNYLKIGLFFNGKFCLYYLDRDNHLYEYHAPDLASACAIVTDFINGQLDLQKFDRHIFNIGNQPHFVTAYFEYHIKAWRVIMLTSMLLFYAMFFIVGDIAMIRQTAPAVLLLIVGSLSLLYYSLLAWIYYKAVATSDNYLHISKGNDVFSFGYSRQDTRTFNKKDVVEIIDYSGRGSRNPNLIDVLEIHFKNGESIKFSNMLISGSDLLNKFSDSMGNMYVKYTMGKKSPLKML